MFALFRFKMSENRIPQNSFSIKILKIEFLAYPFQPYKFTRV